MSRVFSPSNFFGSLGPVRLSLVPYKTGWKNVFPVTNVRSDISLDVGEACKASGSENRLLAQAFVYQPTSRECIFL